MVKRLIMLSLVAVFSVLFAYSAEARTLQGGRAYTFVNNDERAAVFVTISGTANYEYVTRNSDGQVVGFGLGVGRIQVLAGGETTVFVTGNRSVTLPSGGRISIQNAETPVLNRIQVPSGRSVTFENSHPGENRRLMVDISAGHRAYDLIVRDRHGLVTQISEGLIFSNITVPSSGSVVIYAANPQGLTLMHPAEWTDIRETGRGRAALATRTVPIGQSITIRNNHASQEFTVRRQAEAGETVIDYTYSSGAAFVGQIVRRDVTFEEMTIEPGYTWNLTVRSGAPLSLLFPQEWISLGFEIVGAVTPAVETVRVTPGRSMRFENLSEDTSYEIRFDSIVPGVDIQYDYFWQSGIDVGYGIASEDRTRTLLPGSFLVIRPTGHSEIQAILSAEWDIASERFDDTPVFVRDLAFGESIRISNIHENEFRRVTWRNRLEGSTALLDYIIWDREGRVDSFGAREAHDGFEMGASEAISITNREQTPLRIYFPYVWLDEDIEIEDLDAPVLMRQVVRPGESIEIIAQGQRVDMQFAIEHGSQPLSSVEYHYIIRAFRDIFNFGVSEDRYLALINRGRTVVAPTRGTPLAVVIPAQWEGRYMTFAMGTETPLYRIVIRPGGMLRIYNRLGREVRVQITGRYHRREEGEGIRPRSGEEPLEGDLTISNREQFNLIGAIGADVEILMPMEWRDRLIR